MILPLALSYAAAPEFPVHHSTFGPSGDTAVVFVHGWTCDESFWKFQCPALTGGNRRYLITLDLPGHGKSAAPPEAEMSMDNYARAIASVLDRLAVKQAILAGHSLGTPVVRQFARLYPARTRGLILVDGTIYAPDGAAKAQGREEIYRGAAGMATRRKVVQAYLTQYMNGEVRAQIAKVMESTAEATAVGAMRGMLNLAMWRDESPVNAPALAVYQKGHPLSPAYLRRLFPRVEYHTIANTGHFLMMERPAEFNALVNRFLHRLRV
jgi:pimeloyl-ACP methyl ester carboxylesterase